VVDVDGTGVTFLGSPTCLPFLSMAVTETSFTSPAGCDTVTLVQVGLCGVVVELLTIRMVLASCGGSILATDSWFFGVNPPSFMFFNSHGLIIGADTVVATDAVVVDTTDPVEPG